MTTDTRPRAYYNEFDPYAAAWLRNLIAEGLIPDGDVDERSITDVDPDDLAGYTQCHFFAGIGGWALAARLAGWPDGRELWTGSPPCQPFSAAGKQRGLDDERHLWPHYFRLIRARRPAVVMGEQVAAAVGKHWLDGVLSDLEGIGYAGRAIVVPACAVNGPHRRDRLWFVAGDCAVDHGERARLEGHAGHDGAARGRPLEDRPAAEAGGGRDVADADRIGGRQVDPDAGRRADGSGAREVAGPVCARDGDVAHAERGERDGRADVAQRGSEGRAAVGGDVQGSALANGDGGRLAGQRQQEHGVVESARGRQLDGRGAGRFWDGAAWIIGHDGKARRVEPGVRLLAHGVPARVGKLRAYGNAIVPQVAAEVIGAVMDCMDNAR